MPASAGAQDRSRASSPHSYTRWRGERANARRLAWSTAIFSAATGLSRVLGLIREIVAANYFGARGPINAFTVAFQIPNLVRALVADAALSSAFVPVFSELLEKGERARAWRVASTVFWLFLLVVGGLTALFILAAPVLMPPLTDAYDDLTVTLSQILFPIVVLLGLFGIVTGILNSYDEFSIPALTPVFWNLAIIAGLVIGVPQADTDSSKLYVYAGSIVAGTVLQLLLPLPWLRGRDGRLRLALDLARPDGQAGLQADGPGHARARADQRQRRDRDGRRRQVDRPDDRSEARSTRRSASTCCRRGCSRSRSRRCSSRRSPGFATRGDMDGFRDTIARGVRQINFLLIPAARRLGRPRRADRPAALRARRVRARPDARRRGRARRLLDRAHLQRDDADAEPRLLQPAVAVDPDRRRAREPRAERRALRDLLPGRRVGDPALRSRSPTSPASRCCSSRCGAGSAGSS